MFIYTYKLTLKLRFFFFNKYIPQYWTFLVAQWSRNHLPLQERWVQSLGWEGNGNTLILAWEIPRTEEPGGLRSKGSLKRGC